MHFESFRAVRWMRTLNLILQAVLFTTFFAGLNFLAIHFSWRFDLTRSHRYTLSPETRSYLHSLKRPVRVVATFTSDYADQDSINDIKALLREYAFASEANGAAGHVTVDYLDVYKSPRLARELGVDQPNTIFFICGDQKRAVSPGDLYRMQDGEKRQFLGEQVFTAAILDVSSPVQKKIYFMAGQGEYRLDDVSPNRGLSTLRDELRLRNFDVETIDLSTVRKVPDDAALVIAVAPQRVDPYVEEELRQYLSDHAGRVILLLATRTPSGLNRLLDDWGIWDQDVIIHDSNPEFVTEDGDLNIRTFNANSPITRPLIDRDLTLQVGECRCEMPYPDKMSGSGLTITTLAATSTTAWGERNYRLRPHPVFDPSQDLRGTPTADPKNRLGIAVSSERVRARENMPFSVRNGRIVVFGASDLVVNNRIAASQGNETIFLNAVNWCVDRDTQLAIPPRPIDRYQLSLSQAELLRLRYALWFGVPGLVALLGLAVYWARRT